MSCALSMPVGKGSPYNEDQDPGSPDFGPVLIRSRGTRYRSRGNHAGRRKARLGADAPREEGRQGVIWLASQHLSTICYRKKQRIEARLRARSGRRPEGTPFWVTDVGRT